jgi:hypothetical protein
LTERERDDGQDDRHAGLEKGTGATGIVFKQVSRKQEDAQSRSNIGVVEGAEEEQRRKQADVESGVDLLGTQIAQWEKKSRLLR